MLHVFWFVSFCVVQIHKKWSSIVFWNVIWSLHCKRAYVHVCECLQVVPQVWQPPCTAPTTLPCLSLGSLTAMGHPRILRNVVLNTCARRSGYNYGKYTVGINKCGLFTMVIPSETFKLWEYVIQMWKRVWSSRSEWMRVHTGQSIRMPHLLHEKWKMSGL